MMHARLLKSIRVLSLACILSATIGLGGCVHRIGIQQGNFLDQEDVARVTVGMTRVQVRALLGTPMVADPFHQSRWDYYFYLKMGRWKNPMQRHFIVHFDEEDKVARVERRDLGNKLTPEEQKEAEAQTTTAG
jgi:outer membrane protein assembly factor BamE